MAGGTSIWASKDAKTDPKQIFNGRLLYLLITVAWAGCFYGFDSGNIGGILTLPSFENAFGLSGLTQEELDRRSVHPWPDHHTDTLDTDIFTGHDRRYAGSGWLSWSSLCLANIRLSRPQVVGLPMGHRLPHRRCDANGRRLRRAPRWTIHRRHGCRSQQHAQPTVSSREQS